MNEVTACVLPVCSNDFTEAIFKRYINQSIGFKSLDRERTAIVVLTRKKIFKIAT